MCHVAELPSGILPEVVVDLFEDVPFFLGIFLFRSEAFVVLDASGTIRAIFVIDVHDNGAVRPCDEIVREKFLPRERKVDALRVVEKFLQFEMYSESPVRISASLRQRNQRATSLAECFM